MGEIFQPRGQHQRVQKENDMGVKDFDFECSLEFHHPLTEEEWDMLTDAELERTTEITFHTPKGKEIVFVKKGDTNDSNT